MIIPTIPLVVAYGHVQYEKLFCTKLSRQGSPSDEEKNEARVDFNGR